MNAEELRAAFEQFLAAFPAMEALAKSARESLDAVDLVAKARTEADAIIAEAFDRSRNILAGAEADLGKLISEGGEG